tara:strand:- start:4897 stop:5313 length:417 start_codon:yes stop_codon:yes gene_type:complete
MTIPNLNNREVTTTQTPEELSVFYGVKLTASKTQDKEFDDFIRLIMSGHGLHSVVFQKMFQPFLDALSELDLCNYSSEANYECRTETRINKQSWSLILFDDAPNIINCYMNTDVHDNEGIVKGQGDLEIVLWVHGKGK